MLISHAEYLELGYSTVSKSDFPRYAALTETNIQRRIKYRPFIRATDAESAYNLNDPAFWAEMNLRGLCEAIDLNFVQSNPNSDAAKARRTINSFRNDNYSEDYGSPRYETGANIQSSTQDPFAAIVSDFFTPAQTFGGVS